MNFLSKFSSKIRQIVAIVLSTPNYGWIIILQIISGTFSFIGLPLLIPVLEFMQTEGTSQPVGQTSDFMLKAVTRLGFEPNFYTLLTVASILILFGQLLVIFSALVAVWTENNLIKKYSKQILDAYTQVDWLWLTNYHSGEMNYAVIKEVEMATVVPLSSLRIIIYSFQGLVFLALAVKLSFISALLAFFLYGILGFVNMRNARVVGKLNQIYNQTMKQNSKALTGLQQNKKFFKTSLLNSVFIKKIFSNIDTAIWINKKVNMRQQFQGGWSFSATFLFLMFLVLFHKPLSINYYQLLVIVLVFNRLAPHFINLSESYLAFNRNLPMYESFRNRLVELAKNREVNGPEVFDGQGEIRFAGVSFAYPHGNQVIRNISLEILPCRTTAFVGGSGAGKSTVLDLILGLLKPSEGRIYYGSIPHDKLDFNSLRRKVAYVSQGPTLLDGTLRENLLIGCPQASEEKLRDICKKVHLDQFVERLPEGLDTQIGENGIKLSGGQRQRVVLGRSLFMDPRILILDEATSELDLHSEAMIQEAIKSLKEELTIIIVAHRLSTIKLADRLYVIENGNICESGSYEELLERKGKLFFLDSLQR
ncbi:MAG: ABC transporter ATP-binding protein [Candidatus Omnitrophota bacterium]